MGRNRVIVAMLAVGVMNHGRSTVERPNREFAGWDFRGKTKNPLVTPETEQDPQSISGKLENGSRIDTLSCVLPFRALAGSILHKLCFHFHAPFKSYVLRHYPCVTALCCPLAA